IIFDLGGVFIEIDFKKTENAFISLGITNFNHFYTQHTASTLFEDLETGKLNPEEFYEGFRKETGSSITDDQIRDAWNDMLGNFPAERLEWLEEIRGRYKTYLFSNTNIIHYDAFQKIYRECTGKNDFDDYFIRAYYSHNLGLRKPYPESFKKLLELENLNADETLFVDDTAKNINGAEEAGLQTFLLLPPKTVFDLKL
ncbi:MAG TPA: HAD family phosphatase, partial [Segetibacter sp.]